MGVGAAIQPGVYHYPPSPGSTGDETREPDSDKGPRVNSVAKQGAVTSVRRDREKARSEVEK